MSGPHFRDYHVLLDDQAKQLLATTNAIAERVRKVGGSTLRSVQHIMRLARLAGNEADMVAPSLMLAELLSDNLRLAGFMREAHIICDGSKTGLTKPKRASGSCSNAGAARELHGCIQTWRIRHEPSI